MKNLANYILFQIGWFACVSRAAEGDIWSGPAVVLLLVLVHVRFLVLPSERRWEAAYILAIGAAGMLADTILCSTGVTSYPSSESAWSLQMAPPWITALWILLGTLPRHSLGWLAGRPILSAVLGAAGGVLAFMGGERFGATAPGSLGSMAYVVLSLEYALLVPLIMRFAKQAPEPADMQVSVGEA